MSVVFHHVATDGWLWDGDEREVRKSDTMVRWEGLKEPYQIRLSEMVPLRSGPLWYCKGMGWSWTKAVSFLAARQEWKK